MRVAIAEDDEASCKLLQAYLKTYSEKTGVVFEIDCFPDGMKLVNAYKPVYDLLLLDIEMPLLDGMSAARRIRKLDQNVFIIFITNMAKYAINGYEVAFSMKLDKVAMAVQRQEKKNLMVDTEEGIMKIPEMDITYIEVINHRLLIHTLEQTYRAKGSLSEIEHSLSEYHFVRCNKGYLVNLRHINLIKTDTVVVAGEELIISRRKRNEFMLAVMDYYGSGGR